MSKAYLPKGCFHVSRRYGQVMIQLRSTRYSLLLFFPFSPSSSPVSLSVKTRSFWLHHLPSLLHAILVDAAPCLMLAPPSLSLIWASFAAACHSSRCCSMLSAYFTFLLACASISAASSSLFSVFDTHSSVYCIVRASFAAASLDLCSCLMHTPPFRAWFVHPSVEVEHFCRYLYRFGVGFLGTTADDDDRFL